MKKLLSISISVVALLVCMLTVSVAYADYQNAVVHVKADANARTYGQIEYSSFDGTSTYYTFTSFAYPYEVELSSDSFVCDGTPKTPSVTVYDYDYNIIDPSNYVVSYINNVNSGIATVNVTFVGDYYTGTLSENFVIRAKAVKLSSVKYRSKGKIRVKWKKQSGVSGYVVQYSTSKSFKDDGHTCSVLVSGAKKTSKDIGGLAKRKYYVRVCAYKTIDGKKYMGAFSGKKTVKVKKGLSLKGMINYTKTDLSGRETIKKLTNNKVDIKKYKTTYDRMRAIYTWHAKNNTKFVHCLACNSNYNDCIIALYGKKHCYDTYAWIGCNYFINNNGSKSVHKWSVIYISGVPYIFDPRIQGYGNKNGFDYFGIQTSSSRAKKKYQFDGWYYSQTSDYKSDLV